MKEKNEKLKNPDVVMKQEVTFAECIKSVVTRHNLMQGDIVVTDD